MDCRVKPGNDRFERVGLSLTAVMAGLGTASQVYPTCGTQSCATRGKPELRCHPRLCGQTKKDVDARDKRGNERSSGNAMCCAYCARGLSARWARAIAASMLVAGPARTARTPVGGADAAALVRQGAMVSMMMLIPANVLSISPCTR